MDQHPWQSLSSSWARQNVEDAPPSAIVGLSGLTQEESTSTSGDIPGFSPPVQMSDSGHPTRQSSPASSSYSLQGYINNMTSSTSSDQYDFCSNASSPPNRVLLLDRPPNASQRSIAEDSIHTRQMHLSLLDEQVIAAYAAVIAAQEKHRSLLSQRAALQAQICRDKNRLQPALYLPIETLAEIFAYCADEDVYAVWKLSSVCFDWRVAALAYPRLWCKVVIPSHLQPTDQLQITRLWVERTGTGGALDIRYRAVESAVRYSTSIFEEIMKVLASQISRWKYFDLETNLDDCVHICMRLSVGAAPHLEKFYVRESETPATRRNRRLLPCKTLTLGPAPKLKHVMLYTQAWPTATFLRGLTTLTLVSGRIKRMVDLWSVLDGCEDLEMLTLRLPVDHDFDPPGRSRTAPLKLERLHTLSGNAMVLALLPHLLVPSLNTLQVNDVDAFMLMRTLNVLDLRSNPPLHTLQLRNCRLVSGTTGLSLKSIKRLEFHESEVDDNFFLSLSMPTAGTSSWIRPYRTWALPSLEVVVLRRAHYVREEALRRLIEARNPTTPNAMCPSGTPAVGLPSRIKMVDVQECRRVRGKFTNWIQERLGRVSDRFHIPGSFSGNDRHPTHPHFGAASGSGSFLNSPTVTANGSETDSLEDHGEDLVVDIESDAA
ncbi:9567_t:CDS:2 [Acaulospora colombiana]|uniref:9567_t:CDS:1 n=1 Tax=Acaulospora colombiana TaxID=27376 RepID=A0ACA9LBV9_9GLOM|nr:9567_t:CDS:2 [Acaulospora colombiana]